MVIDDVVALFRPEDDRDHVLSQEFGHLLRLALAPVLALLPHLAHADGDLRRPQVGDRNGFEDGFTDGGHARLLRSSFGLAKTKPRNLGLPRARDNAAN